VLGLDAILRPAPDLRRQHLDEVLGEAEGLSDIAQCALGSIANDGRTQSGMIAAMRGGTAEMAEAHSVLLWLDPPQYKVFADVLLKFGATYAGKSKALVGREAALTQALGTILDQQTSRP
jgi:hypothetical protein